ncbi:uncharacterized protein LOC104416238 [Eucalyptus grandis]|nr:uncharacterized protein LOC104416238 [Eucalyptus grandis]
MEVAPRPRTTTTNLPTPLYRGTPTGKEGLKAMDGEGNVKMANAKSSRSSAAWRCRKHPKHRQSAGVCSLCLSKRLSQLSSGSYLRGSTSANRRRYSCSSSPSSSTSMSSYPSSSEESSSCASPIHRHGRFAHEARSGPVSMLFGGRDGLKKSRSVACAAPPPPPKTRAGGEKSKGGFWSKLIPSRRKKNGAEGGELTSLKHSSTLRERVAV